MAMKRAELPERLCLGAATAADLMGPNPVSLRADATLGEARAFLRGKGFSAAPVIDDAGRPVGVLSLTDFVVHEQESSAPAPGRAGSRTGGLLVRDVMTPAVYSVAPETPAGKVVEHLLGLKVHHLFVVDPGGVLVGVISALDVLRHLRPEPPDPRILGASEPW
jgi:CBS domain-containing membrane protein